MLSLIVPIVINVGTFRLSAYRIVLILALVPVFTSMLTGKAGKLRSFDAFFVLFVIWAIIATLAAKGMSGGLESSGMFAIETIGSYFLARTFIRDQETFYVFSKAFCTIIFLMLPLAALEAILHKSFLLDALGKFFDVTAVQDKEYRLGLRRAQVVFEHPILYGVFCAMAFAPAYYCLARTRTTAKSIWRGTLVFLATFFSVSSGALVAILSQIIMMGWDMVTRRISGRWKIFALCIIAGYFLVDALSNRTPYEVFVTRFTFDVDASYNRVLIWEYGKIQVSMTPILGIGPDGDWYRAWWMSPSMDNFWMVIAVSFGLPGLGLLALTLVLIAKNVMAADLRTDSLNDIRKGALISLGGVSVAVFSVHLWNATYVLFIFLWASIVWLSDISKEAAGHVEDLGETAKADDRQTPIWPRPPTRPMPANGIDPARTGVRSQLGARPPPDTKADR